MIFIQILFTFTALTIIITIYEKNSTDVYDGSWYRSLSTDSR